MGKALLSSPIMKKKKQKKKEGREGKEGNQGEERYHFAVLGAQLGLSGRKAPKSQRGRQELSAVG
jgi:hypothetical protein